jgi:hypothetical protein
VTIAVPFRLESPNPPAIYVPARVVNISEIPEQKILVRGGVFALGGDTDAHLKKNQPAAWAAFLASAES